MIHTFYSVTSAVLPMGGATVTLIIAILTLKLMEQSAHNYDSAYWSTGDLILAVIC